MSRKGTYEKADIIDFEKKAARTSNRLIFKFIAHNVFIRWEEEQFKRRELVQKVCSSYRGLGREKVKESPVPPSIIVLVLLYQIIMKIPAIYAKK